MTDLSTIKVRVRKRWWAKPLLAVAPRTLILVHYVSPRAAVAGFNWVARLFETRAIVIDVIDRSSNKPLRLK